MQCVTFQECDLDEIIEKLDNGDFDQVEQWLNRIKEVSELFNNKYGTVQELRSTFSQIKSNIVL